VLKSYSNPFWFSPVVRKSEFSEQKSQNTAKSNLNTTGIVLGLDNIIDNEAATTFGVVVGIEKSKLDIKEQRFSDSEISSKYVGVYGGEGLVNIGALYMMNNIKTNRTAGYTELYKVKQKSKVMHAFAELSMKYNFSKNLDSYDFYPYLGLSATKIDVDGVSESSGKNNTLAPTNMYSLRIEDSNNTITSGTLGFRTKNKVTAMDRTMIYTDFGFRHNFSKPKAKNHVIEAYGQDGRFHIKGASTENLGVISLGLHTELDKRNAIFFEARNEFSKDNKNLSANIGYRVDF